MFTQGIIKKTRHSAPQGNADKGQRFLVVFLVVAALLLTAGADSLLANCQWYSYNCNESYYWPIPDSYWGESYAMRFTPTDCCTLAQTRFKLFDDYPQFSNVSGQGIDVHVFNDDGLGLPGSLVYTQNVPGAGLVFDPDTLFVDLSAAGLVFCDDFHVGYAVVDQVNDNIAIISDDASCGTNRSSVSFSGIWEPILDHFGMDVNFCIAAELCCPTCFADGDADSNGIALSVADLIFLIQFIEGCGPAPVPLYSCDLNGDCVVDSLDVIVYQDYFIYGIGVFDQYGGYPVPTCCNPSASIPVSIEMVHDSAYVWDDGRIFRIKGFYTDNKDGKIVSELYWYLINQVMPPKTALLLEGDTLPEECFSGEVNLTGHIDSVVANPYPYYEDGQDSSLIYFHVQGYQLLSEGEYREQDSSSLPRGMPDESLMKNVQVDPGKFAVLLSGGVSSGNNHSRYWNLLAAYYHYLILDGYDPANIHILYFEGDSEGDGILDDDVDKATISNIQTAFTDIALSIQGISGPTSLFLWVFNHGDWDGQICLLGSNTFHQDDLLYFADIVLDHGCDTFYVVMGQCFAGVPALKLKELDIKSSATVYVTSNAHENTVSYSTSPDDPYLKKILWELYGGSSFDKAMVEACKAYYLHLANLLIQWPGDPWLQAAYDAKSIVWKRLALYPSGSWPLPSWDHVTAFPGGKLKFVFDRGQWLPCCGNIILYEEVWDLFPQSIERAFWNYNIYGYSVYESNERIWCVDAASDGAFWFEVNGAPRPFMLTISSITNPNDDWKNRVCVSSPSNIGAYGGFSIGRIDYSAAEFGEIIADLLEIGDINLPGFNLTHLPQQLGPAGVRILDATFSVVEHNEFWEDTEFRLNVAQVITPGNLTVNLPGASRSDTTFYIDHEGEYTWHVGAVSEDSLQTITFDASETNFLVDAWELSTLVDPSPFLCGDADANGIVNISDAVYMIAYIFGGGPEPQPLLSGDCDCNEIVNISDVVYLIAYIFGGGPEPCADCPLGGKFGKMGVPTQCFSPYSAAVKLVGDSEATGNSPAAEVTIHSDAPISGVQLEFDVDFKAVGKITPQKTVRSENLELFSGVRDGIYRVGLVDLNGNYMLPAGDEPIVTLELAGGSPNNIKLINAILADENARELTVTIEHLDKATNLPTQFSLDQNYPNPFNPTTEIAYALPKAADVRLEIYNVLGQRVKMLVDKHQAAGWHQAQWNGTDEDNNTVASGVYFYRISAGDFADSKKMLLLK